MKKWMCLMLLLTVSVQAEIVGGPQGGKLLDNEAPRAEFFVNAERKVEIRFYDADLKIVTPGQQIVSVIADAPAGKAKLSFAAAGDALVSSEALPEGDGYMIIVQVKTGPEAKTQNFRITYHAETCGECNRAEYACVCDHAGEEEHGHAH